MHRVYPLLIEQSRASLNPLQPGNPSFKKLLADGTVAPLPEQYMLPINNGIEFFSLRSIQSSRLDNWLDFIPKLLNEVGRYKPTLDEHQKIKKFVELYLDKLKTSRPKEHKESQRKFKYLCE